MVKKMGPKCKLYLREVAKYLKVLGYESSSSCDINIIIVVIIVTISPMNIIFFPFRWNLPVVLCAAVNM